VGKFYFQIRLISGGITRQSALLQESWPLKKATTLGGTILPPDIPLIMSRYCRNEDERLLLTRFLKNQKARPITGRLRGRNVRPWPPHQNSFIFNSLARGL
jgi:hypothetical protein